MTVKRSFDEKLMAEAAKAQDWRALDPVCQTLYCRCGATWRSHHKFVEYKGKLLSLPEEGCLKCGRRSGVIRSSSDPESWTLKG